MPRQKISGICSRCRKRPSRSGYCHECKKKHNECCKKRNAKLRESGMCFSCGAGPVHGKALCETCRNKRRERKATMLSEGLCHVCAKPRDNLSVKVCSSCYATKKRCNDTYIDRRTKEGCCVVCGTSERIVVNTLSTRPHCEACFFKRTARNATGNGTQGQLLEDLFNKQGRRCAYTGRTLELGVNASLDHKYPRSKYPELRAEPSNLHWVDASINSMKHDMTHEQFVAICEEVTSHRCK